MRPHGTYVKYVQDQCRCDDCRQANRDYERRRKRRTEPAYVSAHPARQHVRELNAAGVGLKTIAKASGVSHGALSKLMYGDRTRSRGPSKRIRRTNLEKILAVTPADAAAGGRIDAAPTWALLDDMIDAGAPKAEIARHLGTTSIQISTTTVSGANAQAVADLHQRWLAGNVELIRRDSHGNQHRIEPPEPDTVGADIDDLLTTVADLLEARIDQNDWRKRAACTGKPAWLFFPAKGDTETLQRAKQVCQTCPVTAECLDANATTREGVYGGTSARERRHMRLKAAA